MKPVTIKWLRDVDVCEEGIEYFESLDQKYSNPIKLCKKLKADKKIKWLNWFAFHYCKDVKDRHSVRKYITESNYAYLYCKYIKDRPSIRKYITNSDDAYWYCMYVKDRPSVRKYIKRGENDKQHNIIIWYVYFQYLWFIVHYYCKRFL